MQQWRLLRDNPVQCSNKMTNVLLTISQPSFLKTHLIPTPNTPHTSTEEAAWEILVIDHFITQTSQ